MASTRKKKAPRCAECGHVLPDELDEWTDQTLWQCVGCKRWFHPNCSGCADDMLEHCDDCWCAAHKDVA